MKPAKLTWEKISDYFNFSVSTSQGKIPVSLWALYDIYTDHGTGSVSPLIGFQDDSRVVADEFSLKIPEPIIATCDPVQAMQLGLPPVIPFRVQIKGNGAIVSSQFKPSFYWLDKNSRPLMGVRQDGSLLQVARQTYLITEPVFSLVNLLDQFIKTKFADNDRKMLIWGEIQRFFPENAKIEQHLSEITIVPANRFTLDMDAEGQIHPVLVTPVANFTEEITEYKALLPKVQEKKFSQIFSECMSHYALGQNTYVLLPDQMVKALNVVRHVQKEPASKRLAFIANPYARINDALGTSFSDQEVEQFFVETPEFISLRVQKLGFWEPKICAYRQNESTSWIPDEQELLTAILGDITVQLTPQNAAELAEKLDQAIEDNISEIEFQGEQIVATPENAGLIRKLADAVKTQSENSEKPEVINEETTSEEKLHDDMPKVILTPITEDNIEDVGYAAERQVRASLDSFMPEYLATRTLYAHQKAGLQWLQTNWRSGNRGVLLADDMGLGKTIQCLAFMAWVKESMVKEIYPCRPMLIVAPTGLLKNWKDEEKLHLSRPGLGQIFEAYGDGLSGFAEKSAIDRKREFESADWVLTTYETLRDKILYFLPVQWCVIAFDEVQKIKNPVSRLTEMAKSLSSDFSIAVTGTPVENELKDLWSIVDTVAPGFLDSLASFHKTYVKTEDPVAASEKLKKRLVDDINPSLLMRRMKEEHLDGLPEKFIKTYPAEMSQQQAAEYTDYVKLAQQTDRSDTSILEILQKLRKISLFTGNVGADGLSDELIEHSARLKMMRIILDEIADKKERVLIFVESLHLQELLVPYLQRRYQLPLPPSRINGGVDGQKRKALVDKFQKTLNDQFNVMLLSPKAGGVGLTLTQANHVIHLSRWWNPAVEDQCSDRIYRIGQKRPVYIHYPMAVHPVYQQGSFDIKLNELLERKRELSRNLLLPAALTKDEINSLLNGSLAGS
ncbi:DEAD/DEAH box helicase [Tolumonas auensis]|uniref:DEAD/DEAH box helicase n=1 Tax=Tolumonas auensis TaxID=43948 RepID=UPI002AA8EB59|nr:DEAD/DEAH box helicase [Tolumonas auensis]